MDITNKEVINRMKALESKYNSGVNLDWEEKRKRGLVLNEMESRQFGAWSRYSDENYLYYDYNQRRNDKMLILFGDCEGLNFFGENWRTYTLSSHNK
jgi:hypothetical protein